MSIQDVFSLKNIGFMTSVLHSLFSLKSFRSLLLNVQNVQPGTYLHEIISLFKEMEVFFGQEVSNMKQIMLSEHHLAHDDHGHISFMLHSFIARFRSKNPCNGTFIYESEEDAHEFLLFLFSELQHEISSLNLTDISNPISDILNRKVISNFRDSTRSYAIPTDTKNEHLLHPPCPVGSSVCGVLRYEMRRSGVRRKINTLSRTRESFLTLSLDICGEDVHSVQDAINNIFKPQYIPDYRMKTGKKLLAGAWRYTVLEKEPYILIIHLKRFKFSNDRVHKLHKEVDISEFLYIVTENGTFSTRWLYGKSNKYILTSIVSHNGAIAESGKYACFVRERCKLESKCWIQHQNNNISRTTLSYISRKESFLLFYTRVSEKPQAL